MEPLIGGITFAFALGYLAGACSTRLSRKASDPFEEGRAELSRKARDPSEEGKPKPAEESGDGPAGPFYAAGALATMMAAMAKEER